MASCAEQNLHFEFIFLPQNYVTLKAMLIHSKENNYNTSVEGISCITVSERNPLLFTKINSLAWKPKNSVEGFIKLDISKSKTCQRTHLPSCVLQRYGVSCNGWMGECHISLAVIRIFVY